LQQIVIFNAAFRFLNSAGAPSRMTVLVAGAPSEMTGLVAGAPPRMTQIGLCPSFFACQSFLRMQESFLFLTAESR
jgi:hypothetical protein